VHFVELLVILLMIGFNSLFAAYEIALASVSIARLQVLAKENHTGAKAALYMKQNFEASLASVQLGITVLAAIAAATGGAGAEEHLAPFFRHWLGVSSSLSELLAIATVVVPLTLLMMFFGELTPKVFAIRNKELVCLRLSRVMKWFTVSVWPAVWMLEGAVTAIMNLTERWRKTDSLDLYRAESAEFQSLRASAALARASRLIGERQEKIIVHTAHLSGRPVSEIMLPAEYISMLDVNATLDESLIAAHLDMHTRFPVAQMTDDPQSIIGYINLKDLLALMRLTRGQEPTLRAVLRPFPRIGDTTPITASLERMIREHTHIALIVDKADRVVGMVTLEDILEEFIGEIEDEYDRLPAHVTNSGRAWVVGGGIGLQRLKDVTGIDLTGDLPPLASGYPGANTLSNWVSGHLGRPIRGGDELTRNKVRVIVRKIRRQKVLEAQVSVVDTA
jgi:putative hemolysin